MDIAVFVVVLIAVGALLWLGLVIAALVSIIRSERLGTVMKIVWGAIVFFFPFLGTLLWFIVGRNMSDPTR